MLEINSSRELGKQISKFLDRSLERNEWSFLSTTFKKYGSVICSEAFSRTCENKTIADTKMTFIKYMTGVCKSLKENNVSISSNSEIKDMLDFEEID
jgi:hypothetical protein